MKKKIIPIIIISIFIPNIVLAAWWNPLSWFNDWSFKNKAEVDEVRVLKNEIEELRKEVQEKKEQEVSTTTEEEPEQDIVNEQIKQQEQDYLEEQIRLQEQLRLMEEQRKNEEQNKLNEQARILQEELEKEISELKDKLDDQEDIKAGEKESYSDMKTSEIEDDITEILEKRYGELVNEKIYSWSISSRDKFQLILGEYSVYESSFNPPSYNSAEALTEFVNYWEAWVSKKTNRDFEISI